MPVILIQLKPLNVITLGQGETYNKNRMIAITNQLSIIIFSKRDLY
jgi:hypothetical protein